MPTLDRLEYLFFEETPTGLRHAGFYLVFLGFVGGLAIILNAEGGYDPKYLWFAGIGLVPASLCWLLAVAVRARHIATVPLMVLLCALSLYVFGGNPNDAIAGISPRLPLLIVGWFIVVTEYVLIGALMVFMFLLWKRGAFA